jgi:hypothetical protein
MIIKIEGISEPDIVVVPNLNEKAWKGSIRTEIVFDDQIFEDSVIKSRT